MNQKKCCIMIIVVLFCLLSTPKMDARTHRFDLKDFKVNGKSLASNLKAHFIRNTLYMPISELKLNSVLKVDRLEGQRSAMIRSRSTSVKVKIGSSTVEVNQIKVKLSHKVYGIGQDIVVPVLPILGLFNYEAHFDKSQNSLSINHIQVDQATLKNIFFESLDDRDIITAKIDRVPKYHNFELLDQRKLVVDFPNTKLSKQAQNLILHHTKIKGVRLGQFTESTARLVVDFKSMQHYNIKKGRDKIQITIPKTHVKAGIYATSSRESDTNYNGEKILESITNDDMNSETLLKHQITSSREILFIRRPDLFDFETFKLNNPKRIVIDVNHKRAREENQQFIVNSNLLDAVRYQNHTINKTRYVLDLKSDVISSVYRSRDQLVVTLKNSKFLTKQALNNQIHYSSVTDRIGFILTNTTFTETVKPYRDYYKATNTHNVLTIQLDKSKANLKPETMFISDKYIHKLEISEYNNTTTLKIYTKIPMEYHIVTRKKPKDTAITLMPKSTEKSPLIVIDPGHGGLESGAVFDGVYEKDLNLDISMKLDAFLQNKGIRTYMIREDDSFVDLYERSNIANKLNADLFISIHNNAFYAKHHGTETLYYSPYEGQELSSKRFAQIIQDEMIKALKTKNRGIVERPNLVVLKATKMQAALAEIGFITNDEERKKLLRDDFRKDAADAIGRAILQSLKLMNLHYAH